jgi:integrase
MEAAVRRSVELRGHLPGVLGIVGGGIGARLPCGGKIAQGRSAFRRPAPAAISASFDASPDRGSFEDSRRYQLHLVASGAGAPTINHTVIALRFLFTVTLHEPQVVARLPFIREPRALPIVLSLEEVVRLLEAAPSLKYKAAQSVAYGAVAA